MQVGQSLYWFEKKQIQQHMTVTKISSFFLGGGLFIKSLQTKVTLKYARETEQVQCLQGLNQ